MVRKLLLLIFVVSLCFSDQLDTKIKTYMSDQEYHKHSRLLDMVFKNKESFYSYGSVDSIKVLKTLRQNGLLRLSLGSPQHLVVGFKLDFASFIGIKAISDSLASLGYNYFVIDEAKNNEEGFSLKVGIDTEYAPDPILLNSELKKRGVKVVDISKDDSKWSYALSLESATLPDAIGLRSGESKTISRMLQSYWVEIEGSSSSLLLKSLPGNSWHPKVVFYDSNLNILEVEQKDAESRHEELSIPEGSKFIKVSDFFGSYNIKNGFDIALK
ncbi:MAG: hypothetical protein ACLFOC_08405 [Campylobacterales bacterium]